jgi:uncharacterized damage-inducible protein DinB
MDAIQLLSAQIKQAHGVVSGTVADLTPEQAQWSPGGEANPIAAELIHLISAEDMFLNMMVGRQPLGMGPFAGKTGASEPHPMGGYGDWAKRVQADVPLVKEYMSAVFANTEEYVASLKPDELDREIDLSSAGIGKMSLGDFITLTSIVHPSNHVGEISVMKGIQGAKGYPF